MTWTEIWLMNGDLDRASRIAILAQGYVDGNNSIQWTGRIPLEADTHFQLHIYNDTQNSVQMHIVTELES
jgi:hypothetical protein